MSEPSDENDQLRAVLEALPSGRRGLRDARDGVQSDADYFAKHKLCYRERTVGLWGKVNETLKIDWDDPQRVARLIDEMDAGATFLNLALSILCSPTCG
jgi:hypothetical protein